MAELKPQDEQAVVTQPEPAPTAPPTPEPVAAEPAAAPPVTVAEAAKPEPAKEKEAPKEVKEEPAKKEPAQPEKAAATKDKSEKPAAAKEEKDVKARETKEAPKAKQPRAPLHLSADALSLGFVVLLIGYLVFAFWHAYQPSTAGADPSVVQATSTPTIPQLKLNQPARRTGPVISVDSGNIGKEDPFKK